MEKNEKSALRRLLNSFQLYRAFSCLLELPTTDYIVLET